jgi:hypothetical protein
MIIGRNYYEPSKFETDPAFLPDVVKYLDNAYKCSGELTKRGTVLLCKTYGPGTIDVLEVFRSQANVDDLENTYMITTDLVFNPYFSCLPGLMLPPYYYLEESDGGRLTLKQY